MTIHDKVTLSNAITLARLAGFEIDGPAKMRTHRSMGLPLDAAAIRYQGEAVSDLEVAYPVYAKGSCKPGTEDPWPADALKFLFKVNGQRRSVAVMLKVNTSTGEMRTSAVPAAGEWA